eukprot:CAMPEP_0176147516 /NCGR_PEP_ID=MMETSP0120_2-20121206/75201_1 /TAXON_ID=160619 /ORGANISM="Kryptoperidinium foliaceum, Strain CCMP 1326" /LENGTH=66 /DNA_ID=CAMNT_0017484135 /DNA_START=8 /DNA_END=208 /DNA_ORIENTATION=+
MPIKGAASARQGKKRAWQSARHPSNGSASIKFMFSHGPSPAFHASCGVLGLMTSTTPPVKSSTSST